MDLSIACMDVGSGGNCGFLGHPTLSRIVYSNELVG